MLKSVSLGIGIFLSGHRVISAHDRQLHRETERNSPGHRRLVRPNAANRQDDHARTVEAVGLHGSRDHSGPLDLHLTRTDEGKIAMMDLEVFNFDDPECWRKVQAVVNEPLATRALAAGMNARCQASGAKMDA